MRLRRTAYRLGPLRQRDFRLLFLGRSISWSGNTIAPVALAFAVLRLTGSTSDLGIVLAARQVPQIIFLLMGGVFADRLPRHQLMVVSNALAALSQGCAALLLLSHHATILALAIIAAINGIATAFFLPASVGVIPQIVPSDQLQSANVLLRLTANAFGILGPAVGGAVVAATNAGWALAFDACTFAAAALLFSALRLPAGLRIQKSTMVSDLFEGWREFRTRTWLWAIVTQFAIVNAAQTGALNVLAPVQAERHLGGAAAYGGMLAAFSVGFIAGGVLNLRFRARRILLVATGAVLLDVLLPLALARPLPIGYILSAAFISGVGVETFGVLWTVATQQQIPLELLSRLSSYDTLGSWILMPVGLAIAGPVASVVGVGPALIGAAGLMVVATLPIFAVRQVRVMERVPASAAN